MNKPTINEVDEMERSAVQQLLDKAYEKGYRRGKLQGKLQVKVLTKMQGKLETATRMIQDDVEDSIVAKYIGLSSEEIAELREDLNGSEST